MFFTTNILFLNAYLSKEIKAYFNTKIKYASYLMSSMSRSLHSLKTLASSWNELPVTCITCSQWRLRISCREPILVVNGQSEWSMWHIWPIKWDIKGQRCLKCIFLYKINSTIYVHSKITVFMLKANEKLLKKEILLFFYLFYKHFILKNKQNFNKQKCPYNKMCELKSINKLVCVTKPTSLV